MKRVLAVIICVLLCICAVSCAKEPDDKNGANASVVIENGAVKSYSVPEDLFYYTYFDSNTDSDSDHAFRGGAFNSNSAMSDIKAYSPLARLVVPMICVWDYIESPAGEYPKNISSSNGVVTGAVRDDSDTWLITCLPQNFLPTYNDRATIKELVLPMSLEVIDDYAVQDCKNLTAVTLYNTSDSKLQSIGKCAFLNCAALASVELSDTLVTIEDEAFLNCPQLKTVCVPESVTDIRQHALGYTTVDGNIYDKVEGFTICAPAGSAAQEYAEHCGFTFTESDK